MQKTKYIGFLISLIFLAVIIYKINFQELVAAFYQASYPYLLPALILYMGSFFIRALRWKFILQPLKTISLGSSFSIIMIAWMANNVLPARMGEFVRAYVIGKKEHISVSASLATIVIERVFDGLTLVGFLVILLCFYPFPDWVKRIGYLSALLFIFALICLIALKNWHDFIANNIIKKFTTYLPDKINKIIIGFAGRFVDGLQCLSSGRRLIVVIIYSLLVWVLEGLMYYYVIRSFNLNLLTYASFFLLTVTNLGLIVPSAPGYVGTFQFFSILSLKVFGIDKNVALSFSIALHALQYLPVTLLGLIYLNKEGLKLTEFRGATT